MAEANEFDEETPGYKAPAKVDLETLQNLDKEDEALNRWKAQLLAGAQTGTDLPLFPLSICSPFLMHPLLRQLG